MYSLDSYGPLPYAGLQGAMSILAEIRPKNDLGNWLPGNLRSGDWLLDYTSGRLLKVDGTKKLGMWLRDKAFAPMKGLPRYLVPRYFDAVVTGVYTALLEKAWYDISLF